MNQNTAARKIQQAMRAQFATGQDGQMLTDPITQNHIPTRYYVDFNKQAYNARSLQQWIDSGHVNLPHSRRRLHGGELGDILRKAVPINRQAGDKLFAFMQDPSVGEFAQTMMVAAHVIDHPETELMNRARLIKIDKAMANMGYRLWVQDLQESSVRVPISNFLQLAGGGEDALVGRDVYAVPHFWNTPIMDPPLGVVHLGPI